MTTAPETMPTRTPLMQRILGAIERGGNKMPNPAILFVWLCVIVIVLSALLAWADIKATYQVVEPPPVPVEEVVQGGSTQPSGGLPDASVQEGDYTVRQETATIQSLLSADGVRFLFTSFVANFRNFAAVAIILVVMIGVGLAEAAGLIGALIRKLVSVSSEAMQGLPTRARRCLQRRRHEGFATPFSPLSLCSSGSRCSPCSPTHRCATPSPGTSSETRRSGTASS